MDFPHYNPTVIRHEVTSPDQGDCTVAEQRLLAAYDAVAALRDHEHGAWHAEMLNGVLFELVIAMDSVRRAGHEIAQRERSAR